MRRLLLGCLALTACGDAPADDPTDAAAPIDASTNLRIELARLSGGLLGIESQITVTDGDGTVRLSGPPPGYEFEVPVHPGAAFGITEDASSSPTSRSSYSTVVRELGPGDVVRHGDFNPIEPSPVLPGMVVTYPAAPDSDQLLTRYYVATACAEFGYGHDGLARIPFREDCRPTAPFDAFLYTVDGDGVGPWILPIRNITYVPDGMIAAPGPWIAMPTVAVTVRGLPDDATGLSVRRASNGIAEQRAATVDPTAITATVEVPALPGQGGPATVEVVVVRASAIGVQRHTFAVRADATLDLDLAAHPLPWITSLPAEGSNDDAWTQAGDGTPDAAVVTSSWSSTGGPPFSSGGSTVISSGTVHTGAYAGKQLTLVDHPAIAGYAELKHDHKRRFLALTEGQVEVQSVAPADVDH